MNRIQLLRHIAVTFAGAVAGTTTAAGSSTTAVDTALVRYPNDHFNAWDCYFEGGTLAGVLTGVTDFAGSTGTVTFPTQAAGSSGSGVRYILAKAGTIELLRRVIQDAYSNLREQHLLPYLNEETTLDYATPVYDYTIPYAHEADLTADSGNAGGTTIVDAALTQANDYWLGAVAAITSGTPNGESRTITDFVATTDTLTLGVPLSAQITTNTYTLYKFRPAAIHKLQYKDANGFWQDIPWEAWSLTNDGGVTAIHFYNRQADHGQIGRVWDFAGADTRVLRIIGSRYAIDPNADGDPIELPQSAMVAWCRYLYYLDSSVASGIDPAANLQKVQMAYQMAREERDNIRTNWPPRSRRLQQ